MFQHLTSWIPLSSIEDKQNEKKFRSVVSKIICLNTRKWIEARS
jgi:hypothetical protein